MIHSNPAMTLDSPLNADERNQTRRAARITHAALLYAEKIQRSAIPREYTKDSPMCMAQYTRIFSHCRVPAVPSDKLVGFTQAESRHIIVAHKNQFYSVDVYHPTEGRLLSSGELEGQLNEIVLSAQQTGAKQVRVLAEPYVLRYMIMQPAVGIFTSEHRDTWAGVYNKLRTVCHYVGYKKSGSSSWPIECT